MKVIASWDDAAAQDMRVADLMKKYEIPTIFYWPVNLEKSVNMTNVSKFLTLNQCLELSKNFEVGSHTVTHSHLTRLTTKQVEYELKESRKFWQDKTGQPVNSLCYPRGYATKLIQIMVKNSGYASARSVVIGNIKESEDPFWTMPSLHVGIDRIEYKKKSWEVYGRELLKEAKNTPDSIFHIFGHSWEIEKFNDWENLENFLKELKN